MCPSPITVKASDSFDFQVEMFRGNDLSQPNVDNHCALIYMLIDLVDEGIRKEEVVEFMNAHIRNYFNLNNNFGRAIERTMNLKYGTYIKPLKFEIADDRTYEKFLSRTSP